MKKIPIFIMCLVSLAACAAPAPPPTPTAPPTKPLPTATALPPTAPPVAAVEISFKRHVLPLFTQPNMWYEGSMPCTACHFAMSDKSAHELDMGTYQGILTGADSISEPPGEKIIVPGKWSESELRARLRNNRMPAIPGQAGWTFVMDESNRDGPCVKVSAEGVEIEKDAEGKIKYTDCASNLTAVELIGKWVDAGAPDN